MAIQPWSIYDFRQKGNRYHVFLLLSILSLALQFGNSKNKTKAMLTELIKNTNFGITG